MSDEELTVERISLLYTNFKRVANGKAVQIPNIILNNLWIENITRSRLMREFVSVFVSFATSFEEIKLLENELRRFVSAKEHARDYQPEVDVSVVDIAQMDKLELRVEMRYKGSWHSDAHRASRRSKFLCEVVRVLREIPIYGPAGGDAPLGSESKPTYSVAVDDEWAAKARRKFEEEKDRERMFPKGDDDDGGGGNETRIDNNTNTKYTDVFDGNEKENNPFSSTANSNENIRTNNNQMGDSSTSWSGLSATLTSDNQQFNKNSNINTKEQRALELLNHPSPTDDFTRDDALGMRGPAHLHPHTHGHGPGASTATATLGSGSLIAHPVDQEHVRQLMRRESSRGKRKRAVGVGVTMEPTIEVEAEAAENSTAAGDASGNLARTGSLADIEDNEHEREMQRQRMKDRTNIGGSQTEHFGMI